MKLQRCRYNPILTPNPQSVWESNNVFNPSVILHQGLFHMHYRAQGLDEISRIGYAVSEDGVSWNRLRDPVLEPDGDNEARGVEDPRVTEIDGVFYMAYTAFMGQGPQDNILITPMFARGVNLITWDRIGPLVDQEENKDHFLLPEKIGDRFIAFHRRFPNIWYAESVDMENWPEAEMRVIMSPRPDNGWDCVSIGGNGPPIRTEHGWLFFYHAYDESLTYRLGVAMLDLEDPAVAINRPRGWILEPRERWEKQGNVPNVVFSCANIRVGDQVWVYYGGADRAIGLATCDYDEVVDYARFG